MTDLLMIVAVGLMLAAVAAWLMSGSISDAEKTRRVSPTTQSWLIAMMVVGCVVAFGGFWIEWLLWMGYILTDAGLLAFSILAMRRPASHNEKPPT